jgi:ABC-type multidrug transport system permease subunit
MISIQDVLLMFPDERAVFLREQTTAMYSPTAYFIGKILSELPGFFIFPSSYLIIVYFGTELNLNDASHFFIFYFTSIMLAMAASGFSFIMGAAIGDKQLAVALTPVCVVPFMLFSGFFVNQDQIPVFLKPFEYLSLFKYGFQVLILNEYGSIEIE